MAKHTQGPYCVTTHGVNWYDVHGSDGYVMTITGMDKEQADANLAHVLCCLNSHAELAEALKDILNVVHWNPDAKGRYFDTVNSEFKDARAALKKAGY